MLSYAFNFIKHTGYADINTEEFDNIHDLFAAVLAQGFTYQLKKGLHKEYIHKNDNLTTVRGKINLNETIRNKILQKRMVNCDFDELSENNIYNQIIKSAIHLLLCDGKVKQEHRNRLKQGLLFLSDVDNIDLRNVNWKAITFNRNNQNYRILINICYLLTRGLLLTTESSHTRLAEIIDEQSMSRLYEKFILEYYRQEYGNQITANALQISWVLDDENKKHLPIMQTDVTLTQQNNGIQKILIIDAKYYQRILSSNNLSNKPTLHSGNLYQIFTYVKNKEAKLSCEGKPHEVSGMLLYAKTDEEEVPDNTYSMSGNKISVKNLDLSVDFSEIRSQLDNILNCYFQI